MANVLQEQLGDVLLDKIRGDTHPSVTQMDILESIASPRTRTEYALHLIDRIEEDPRPSIPMMHRVVRLVAEFGI